MKTTEENNQMIAEFLGANSEFTNEHGERFLNDIPTIDGGMMILRVTRLKYDSDWNWLMLVIERIEDEGYTVNIKGISCTVTNLLNEEPIVSWVLGDRTQKIKLVYRTVVEFIKWYNSQT